MASSRLRLSATVRPYRISATREQVPFPFGFLRFDAELLLLLLDGPDLLDQLLFVLPVSLHLVQLLVEPAEGFVELFEPVPGGRVGLLFQGLAFDLDLGDLSLDLIDFRGEAVDFDPELGSALVDQVDGLVRQETVGDVPLGQGRRRHDGRIGDPDAVVHLVFLLESPEDRDGVLHRGLFGENRLESALQRGIFFDVLTILVEGGGPHTAQRPPGQGRLEHIGGVHGPFGRPGAHQGVQFVDEQDDLPLGGLHLLDHRLETVFELAPVLGAGDEGAHVQGHQPPVLEAFGDIPGDDPLGQALDDGGFAHAGLADEHGIVLRAAREYLDDAPNLLVPADDRIELAGPGQLGQVAAEFFQGLVLFFRVRVGNPLGAADLPQHLEDRIPAGPVALEDAGGLSPLFVGDRQQDVLHAHVLVFHLRRFGKGRVEHSAGARRDIDLSGPADLREPGNGLGRLLRHGLRSGAQLAQDRGGDPLSVADHRREQVLGLDLVVALGRGQVLGFLDQLLGLDGKLVESHSFPRY